MICKYEISSVYQQCRQLIRAEESSYTRGPLSIFLKKRSKRRLSRQYNFTDVSTYDFMLLDFTKFIRMFTYNFHGLGKLFKGTGVKCNITKSIVIEITIQRSS